MKFFRNAIQPNDQSDLILIISKLIDKFPFYNPTTPKFNKPFNMKITSAGLWGWNSDKNGYCYTRKHPYTNSNWPKIPRKLINIWNKYCGKYEVPNSCLFNLYEFPNSKLGLHQDKEENDFSFPVLSLSIGSTAIFKYGRTKNKLNTIKLESGTIVIMEGASRLAYHGITKILKTEDNILNDEKFNSFPPHSRISITLRMYKSNSK